MHATKLAVWILVFGLLQPARGDAPAGPEPAAAEPSVEAVTGDEPTAEAETATEPAAADSPPVGPPPQAEPAAAVPAVQRVQVDLHVEGELFAPAGRDAEPVRQPIAVEARFDFIERSGTGPAAVVRDYTEAAAVVRIADAPARFALPADARRVEV
ncbi:MAG: hypothetical protein ACKOC4_09770, partial [Planctomycetia bacterium]